MSGIRQYLLSYLSPISFMITVVLLIGIGVGFAVVAGGVAVVNAFASGALVTVATAVIAYIGIRYVIRCLR